MIGLRTTTACGLLAALCLTAPAAGQFEQPEEEIRKIAEEVAKEMQEIDRLLLRRGNEGEAAQGIARAADKIDELLKQTTESQSKVVDKMDKLIEQILRAQQQSQSSGQGQGQQKPEKPDQSRVGQPRTQRQRSDTPQGNPDREQTNQQPQNSNDQPERGENVPSAAPKEDETERVEREADVEGWGMLQLYEQLLKSRGSRPKVPEKYRRYYESYLKQGRRTPQQRRTP